MKRNREIIKVQNPGDTVVTIMHGLNVTNVFKEQLLRYTYSYANQLFDITRLGAEKESYINAFEWLMANIFRVNGIQLYEDGEIRLNISPSQIKNNKKCLFLIDDNVLNRELDGELYVMLFDLIYGKPDTSEIN
jgi:hypothetical protein